MRVQRLLIAAGVLIYGCRYATDTCACTPALYRATVHGQVRTADGEPLTGVPVEVALHREACGPRVPPASPEDVNVAQRSAQTDAQGAYEVRTASPVAIPAGCVLVSARVNPGTPSETTVRASAPLALTSSAGEGSVRIDLVPP